MQQTAGFTLRNIPSELFDKVADTIKVFFEELEDKPKYWDEWCKGLCLYKNDGMIRLLSDIHADYFDYDVILTDFVEYLAENVKPLAISGYYDLANDDEGPEYHNFEITVKGEVVWGKVEPEETEICDELLWEAVGSVYGEANLQVLYKAVFGALSSSDIKKAFDICAAIYCDGGDITEVYEEFGVDIDSPSFEDLLDIFSECNDNMGLPDMYSYVCFLVDTFAAVGIDIKFPEELKIAIEELS